MKFTKLEDAALKPLDVTVLDLSGWVVTADLVQFPNLILLRISDGNLELSEKVKLPQLEDLLLVNRNKENFKRLSFLPLVFPNLLSLHLEYIVNSAEIGENISEFKRLEKLIINQGILFDLNFIKDAPKTLNYLDVGANQLREIPDSIGKFKNLERLFAPANRIKKVSSKLANLKKLRILDLSNNQISRLPRMNKLSNLFTLEVSNNDLGNFPKSLTKCAQLHELFISNNYFQKLIPEICNMHRLRILSVHSCQLKTLPRNFKRLQSLRQLGLGENLFQSIPNSVCEISKLERLNFNNNQIKKLPNAIRQLTELRRLELAGNGIKELPLAIGKLRKLSEMNLERNSLSKFPSILITLPETDVRGIPRRKFLSAFRQATSDALLKYPQKLLLAYDLILGEKRLKTSMDILAELTHIKMPALQRKVKNELVKKGRGNGKTPKLEEGSLVAIIGSQSTDFQSVVSSSASLTEDYVKADLLVVGNEISGEQSEILRENKTKILTKSELLSQIFKINPPYLLLKNNDDAVKNLEELFLSPQIENKQIALSAMTFGGVPQSLKEALIFLAISRAEENEPMREAEQLCTIYLSPNEQTVAEYFWSFYFGKYSSPFQPSFIKLEELCKNANFNYINFNAFWVSQNDMPF